MKVVLVASDLRPRSSNAIRVAGSLAEMAGASLVAVHIVQLPTELRTWGRAETEMDVAIYRRLVRAQVALAQESLQEQVERCSLAGQVRCIARAGWVAETVLEIADQQKADLIVIGRGKAGILGQHAERIARLEGRSVLVAPVKLQSNASVSPSGGASRVAPSKRRAPARSDKRR